MATLEMTALPSLTRRESRTLAFIMDYVEDHGYPPTNTVTANHLGVNAHSNVTRIIANLLRKGYISVGERVQKTPGRRVTVTHDCDGQPVSLNYRKAANDG